MTDRITLLDELGKEQEFIILATFGLGIAVLLVIPFLLSLFKTISYKVKKQIENAKIDIDARASQKKIRQEKLRTAQNELANKKLQNKLNKIAKQIELEEQKTNKLLEDFKTKKIILDNVQKLTKKYITKSIIK